jgi:hypothetical protein
LDERGRVMSGTTGQQSAGVDDCFLCERRAGREEGPVGGYLHKDDHVLVGHGFVEFAAAGSLLVESRRHVLDPGSMTQEENEAP